VSEGKIGLKAEYFSNTNLEGTPIFKKQDEKINFSWTLGSPDDSKLIFDQYSIRWTGELLAPKSGTYELGLKGNDGFRMYINNDLVIDNWEKLSFSTKTIDVNFAEG